MILDVLCSKPMCLPPLLPDETNWHGQKPVAKLILNKIKKYDNVLEIGIGKGGVTQHLLKKEPYLNIIGFDINRSSLEKVNHLLKKKCKGKYKVLLAEQNINLMRKFGKNKFDFVINCGVLDYAKNPDNVIKNVKSLLKKGGYFAFTLFDNLSSNDYDGKSPKQRYISISGIKTWGYSDFYIRQMLKRIGLKIESISLFKKLYKNRLRELSHNEIKAIRLRKEHYYDDHFVILVRKK